MQTRRFLLFNLLLLLLYLWTLTETSPLRITVDGDQCTAIVPERSLTVSCTGLGASIGLYAVAEPPRQLLAAGPLDWLIPGAAFGRLDLYQGQQRLWTDNFTTLAPHWQTVRGTPRITLGELHAGSGTLVLRRPLALDHSDSFTLSTRLRRAKESAAIVLLDDSGENGLAFIVTAGSRRSSWWRWEDNRLAEPLTGIPYQKPLLAQSQSFLRHILAGYQGALVILLAAWLLNRLLSFIKIRRSPSLAITRHPFALLPLILITFALTIHIAIHILERIPHVQDSVTYLFQAQTLARGKLWAPAPPLPEFFEQEFLLVRDGRWFGKYPPGFPAVLALGVLAGAPWLVNPLLATLTVPLLYTLGRLLYNHTTGLLAALLSLASPFFLFMSGSHMSHPAELFWITLFMSSWLLALRHHNTRQANAYGALAGLALGLTFLTRQLTTVALGLPFLALTLLPAIATAMRTRTTNLLQALVPYLRPALITAAISACFLILLLAYQSALTGDPFTDPRLLFWDYDRLGFGQEFGEGQNAYRLALTEQGLAQIWFHDPGQPPRGHTPARGIFNLERNWEALQTHLFGWFPMFTTAFIWLLILLRRPTRSDRLLLYSAALLISAHLFYWASGISYGPRYFYAALPALLLLSARGLHLLAQHTGRPATAILLLTLLGGALLLSAPTYIDQYRGYNFVDRHKLTLVEQANIQQPALIFVDPRQDWWEYGSVFSANTPWLDSPTIFARDLGPTANHQLLTHFPTHHPYHLKNNHLTTDN